MSTRSDPVPCPAGQPMLNARRSFDDLRVRGQKLIKCAKLNSFGRATTCKLAGNFREAAPMTSSNEVLLCSACFDQHRCARILEFVARATCFTCGRRCLGYLTEI